MNEKDLVTFEQAKKLKELGFVEECLYHFNEFDSLESNDCSYPCQSVEEALYSYNKKGSTLGHIDAPFLYQVQNWLREEKNIHIVVNISFPNYQKNDFSIIKYYFWCTSLDGSGKITDTDNEYDTYSEALNAGIDKALELL